MLRVAICDDEINTCQEVERMLIDISCELDFQIESEIFYSGESLIGYLEKGKEYDYIILDIDLLTMSGVDVGKYVREQKCNFHTQIVFISSKETYAMKLFSVQPLDFLVKPISKSSLKKTIERGIEVAGKSHYFYSFKVGHDDISILCKEILYIASEKRIVNVVCRDERFKFYGKISEESKKLPDNFVRIHNSYIVNLDAIRKSRNDYVEMQNGETLSVSRKYVSIYKKTILRRWSISQGG